MRYGLVSLALLTPLAFIPFRPHPPSEVIRTWCSRDLAEPLSRVEAFPIPGHSDRFVAICDYQREWNGFFGVYHISGNHVQWQAQIDAEPDEQSIDSVRSLLLPGFKLPIVEVFGMTHRGNGNLYLYELKDRQLRLLLTTKAVEGNAGLFMFQGGRLTPEYRDLNGDGYADLILEGIEEEWDEKGKNLIHREPLRQVFLWDPTMDRFSEDVSSREGVAEYYD